jgi:hypothetical protein
MRKDTSNLYIHGILVDYVTMLWNAVSLLLVIQCYLATVGQAVVVVRQSYIQCAEPLYRIPGLPEAGIEYKHCDEALRKVEDSLTQQQKGLFRDLLHRQLRNPTRTDKLVLAERIKLRKLPIRVVTGTCQIDVRYEDGSLDQTQPLISEVHGDFFDSWEHIINGIKRILTECLRERHLEGEGGLTVVSNNETFRCLFDVQFHWA